MLPVLLARVLGEGRLGVFQLLRSPRQLEQVLGGPPPLVDPAVGLRRIGPEHFQGFFPGRLGNLGEPVAP